MKPFLAEDFRSLLDKLDLVEQLGDDKVDTKVDTKVVEKPTTGNQKLSETKKIVKK